MFDIKFNENEKYVYVKGEFKKFSADMICHDGYLGFNIHKNEIWITTNYYKGIKNIVENYKIEDFFIALFEYKKIKEDNKKFIQQNKELQEEVIKIEILKNKMDNMKRENEFLKEKDKIIWFLTKIRRKLKINIRK